MENATLNTVYLFTRLYCQYDSEKDFSAVTAPACIARALMQSQFIQAAKALQLGS